MHLTRTEIENRLWPPGRDFPGALVYYSYYCTSLFPKNLFFFPSLPFQLASAPFVRFHQHISFFTEQWKDKGGRNERTSLLLIVMGKSGEIVLASLLFIQIMLLIFLDTCKREMRFLYLSEELWASGVLPSLWYDESYYFLRTYYVLGFVRCTDAWRERQIPCPRGAQKFVSLIAQ